MYRRLIAAALLSAAAACASVPSGGAGSGATVSRADVPSAFAGIPNLTFDHYTVSGANAAEVRRSLDARRPFDPNVGRRVDALTTWAIDFAIPGGPSGCNLDRATVSYRARVQLPRLAPTATLAPAEMERWRAFLAWLEEHESWHARHAWEHVDGVLAAIRASSCDRAAQDAGAVVQAVAREQLAFDQASREGHLGGVRFP